MSGVICHRRHLSHEDGQPIHHIVQISWDIIFHKLADVRNILQHLKHHTPGGRGGGGAGINKCIPGTGGNDCRHIQLRLVTIRPAASKHSRRVWMSLKSTPTEIGVPYGTKMLVVPSPPARANQEDSVLECRNSVQPSCHRAEMCKWNEDIFSNGP